MPIKEISVESEGNESIRHGHMSILYYRWARRPLPVCQATVFASLVSDPANKKCPQAFKDALRYFWQNQFHQVRKEIVHLQNITNKSKCQAIFNWRDTQGYSTISTLLPSMAIRLK